ncbi:MSMEG_0565 family glycosyltransferase [Comamonadaceae bacterium PP-2]
MTESLSIALFTHSVNPRGGVVHTLELAQALQAHGHTVTVIAPARPGQTFFRPVAGDSECVVLTGEPAARLADDIGLRIHAIEQHLKSPGGLLQRRRFDIFHAQDPIGANALANLRGQGLVPHFVRTVHHLDHFDDVQLATWQERGYREADAVLCVSPMWQQRLRHSLGRDCGLVCNGVDLRRYRPLPGPGDGALRRRLGLVPGGDVVLCIGGIEERKNTVRLLHAFAQLRASRPAAQLVVAGGASLLDHSAMARDFQQALAQHGLAQGPGQAVVVTGPLPDADMPGLMRLASVTAMPSLREGFGLVVLESLACGTPVVVSRIRPFVDYLAPQDACWADPLDPSSIAQALGQAIDGYDPVETAATARRLADHYDWHVSARQHVVHYRRLLMSGARGSAVACDAA